MSRLCILNSIAALLAIDLAPLLLRPAWFSGSNSVTTRFRWSTSRVFWRYDFCYKTLRSKVVTRLRSVLLGGKFCLLSWTPAR